MESFKRSDAPVKSGLPVRFDKWLRKVMYNILRNNIIVLKRDKIHIEHLDIDDFFDSDEESDSWDPFEDYCKDEIDLGETVIRISNDSLAEGLKRLTKSEKEILGDIFVLELSTKEIAKKRNISTHTVKNKKSLMLNKLKKILEEVIDGA